MDFFTIFGWSGIAMLNADYQICRSFHIKLFAGLAMMFAMATISIT